MSSFNLDSLVDSLICYKSINPGSIDLILTNKKNPSFYEVRHISDWLI